LIAESEIATKLKITILFNQAKKSVVEKTGQKRLKRITCATDHRDITLVQRPAITISPAI